VGAKAGVYIYLVEGVHLVGSCKAVLPGCTVGSRQAEHESHRESMEEDDMVMRVGNSLVQRRTDGGGRRLQARGAYKGWPRPSRRLALAAPESSRDVAE